MRRYKVTAIYSLKNTLEIMDVDTKQRHLYVGQGTQHVYGLFRLNEVVSYPEMKARGAK